MIAYDALGMAMVGSWSGEPHAATSPAVGLKGRRSPVVIGLVSDHDLTSGPPLPSTAVVIGDLRTRTSGRVVQVHCGDHGWCNGADPNVAWRVCSR